jgi:hypothetical protein
MAALEEAKNMRDMAIFKVVAASEKLLKSVEEVNERTTQRNLTTMRELYDRFEQLQVSFATKAKIALTSPDLLEAYNRVYLPTMAAEEKALEFLDTCRANHEKEAARLKRASDAEKAEERVRTVRAACLGARSQVY